MIIVAICEDRDGCNARRRELLAEHGRYLVNTISSFLVNGPLAKQDNVDALHGSAELFGSIYCMECADVNAARAIMERDPYFGPIWANIRYFRWTSPSGAWLQPQSWPKGLSPDYRCYVAMPPAETIPALGPTQSVLLGGDAEELTEGSDRRPIGLFLLKADTLRQASDMVGGVATYPLPIAAGRWVNITSVQQIPVRLDAK